ncbi:MAG: tetratricopeptide repeat protein, partial [Acidobacteria bacterium]|nr:tetratricopeptide repeat protein [Acidobacteriota bacterium]
TGLTVLSDDERELAYQRLRIPLTVLPTRATAIRIAREAGATLVVVGTYSVTPSPNDQTAAALQGTARVIRVNEGRWMGETMPDGRWAWRPFDFGGQLRDLQRMQGRLAYDIMYERDRALPFSLNQFMQRAERVPYRAFESYVKGIMTENPETRSAYLQNALREYANAHAGATYPQAAFALGQLFYSQRDWARAAEYFSRLQRRDPHYTEAAFYAAISYWRMNDLVRALGALLPLTTDVPLTSIYNNAGALSVQAARRERDAAERERLLTQGINFLRRASESAPDDPTVRFNYAYALFLKGQHAEAVEQLRPVITSNPRDGEAYFLFAKSLERTGRAEAAAEADNQARRYYPGYARWQTEWQRSQTANEVPLRLRQEFNRLDYY